VVEESAVVGKKRDSPDEVTPADEEITSPTKKLNSGEAEDVEEKKDESAAAPEKVEEKPEGEEKVVETPAPEKEVAVKTIDEPSGITAAAEVAAQ